MQSSLHKIIFLAEVIVVLLCTALLFNIAPNTVHAATRTTTVKPVSFEVSGWIPYWRAATGTTDVLPHLSQMTEVNPFGYTVKHDGSLNDAAGLEATTSVWSTLIQTAHAKKVRVIPTVMTSDTDSIHNILSDPTLRAAHEDAIVAMVNKNNFDGVDIDYEGKRAEDKAYYATFLKELYAKMGKKWVTCTIEARTPVDSRYLSTPPADATVYANDLVAINKYCDRVKLMTYDQQQVDLKLGKSTKGLYAPVADPAWVTKVVALMSKDIKKSKMVIGVATYGYIYQVIPQDDGTYDYSLIESFNPRYATELAASLGITPVRNAAGELSFTYVPTTLSGDGRLPSQATLSSLAPAGTPTALLASVGAVRYAEASSGKQAPFYMLWWSDSKAIADKVALAKKLGVRGVAVFKMDGGEDQNMWTSLVKK